MGCRRREAVVHKTTIGISQCMPGTAQNHGTITTWLDVRGEMYSRRDIWARVRDGAHLWTIWQMIIPKPLDEMASVQTLSLSIIDFINPIYQHFYLFSAKQPPEAILTWCDIEGAMENKFGTSFTKEAHARRDGRAITGLGTTQDMLSAAERMPALGTNVLRIELTLDKDDAILAKDECDAIEQNPLGDSLSAVREALREAESKIPNEASESHDSNDPERPRLFTAPIGTLL
ncbi:hypothetical protein G6O67_000888 [Ophiocordyceps sinensis]|uniref:Uncharacterized protein n=2 Tax=Ophiocordyceps sinensis TaxID=72228 RepID=A0A8H4PZZ2_9HYPO|nr:hypothetical protein G6O67_000888 [Ophiocordyceps sinensis]